MLLRKNISMIVSDMAGTTINESGLIYQSIADTLTKLQFPVNKDDKKTWHGRDKFEVLEEHIDKYSDEILNDEIYKKANDYLLEDLSKKYFSENKVTLIDDEKLSSFFNYHRINNIKVALNTGYPSVFQNKIINHFKMNYFIDDWISSETVQKGRPHPYMIQELMKKHGITDPQTVCKIGDTENDMKEGKNANCGLVVGVLTGEGTNIELIHAGADIVVEKITDLLY